MRYGWIVYTVWRDGPPTYLQIIFTDHPRAYWTTFQEDATVFAHKKDIDRIITEYTKKHYPQLKAKRVPLS